jgi:signal transduction histidine kinase
MPWSGGPAAVVLVERIVDSGSGSSGIFLTGALAVVVGLLLAVWLAAGPVVRRIRRLTEAVRRSSDSNYETGVETRGTDEVSRLARAFDEAATTIRSHLARIESRERTLREFVANTTHDVAIPLTVLQGHLARLQALAERADGSAQDAARAAVEEAHYIGSLLQNLAAAAKLESGEVHLDLHPVDLGALVERVAARHAPIAAASSVTLEHSVPEEPVLAAGDHTLLEQAVNNAVHNAIRHNRAGGHAAVILETPRSKAGRFLLRVVDDGPGIPDTERNHMLERGARGTAARTRAPDGLGLGLHIANTVAKRHGFALTLAESEFGGLELSIEGPLAPGDLATS